MSQSGPIAMIILDGFALRSETVGNAVKLAKKPNFDRYWNAYPHSQLTASGEAVGLPAGQMGNSEVGHLNIGAGRIVYQSLSRINLAIRQGELLQNKALLQAIDNAKKNNSALHLMGLLSDGGVHSHINHLFALLELAKQHGLTKVFVHAFLDGRDVGPRTAEAHILATEAKMKELGIGKIATLTGRYFAMDRDCRWERVKKVYDVLVYRKGEHFTSALEALEASYMNEKYDEFMEPVVITDRDEQLDGKIVDHDSVIFFNFRPDRAIQLSAAFVNNNFSGFDQGLKAPKNLHFVMMTNYSDDLNAPVAFETINLNNTLGEVLANNGITQLRIAETEKYPHVTYFMSGGKEDEFPGEKRVLIDSPKVATYDLKPEMSVYEVTEALLAELNSGKQKAIILNYANPDMVGHSGKLEPTIKAIEAVDECLGKVVDKITELGGVAIITADHGNSDEVITLEGTPMTAHTTNPVPVIITKEEITLREDGILADLAPTMLELLNLKKPAEMTGNTLINK